MFPSAAVLGMISLALFISCCEEAVRIPANIEEKSSNLLDELEIIRLLIDQKVDTNFEWAPYCKDDMRMCIPPELRGPFDVWMAVVPLICYAIVEWHLTDRLLR
ncbi:serine/threonine-protein phosphatase 7 long form homolog [Hibiscus syriacus]|uniref:serine/threonine-protein phosphatase 7 long form homolog n=1 Tax=Hibiscus syriacus TaxID=106335 RepID=UPI001921D8F5|nr:serine/threonine-protein phosphatase 7 long form homolog [Hibiscus syriacus]